MTTYVSISYVAFVLLFYITIATCVEIFPSDIQINRVYYANAEQKAFVTVGDSYTLSVTSNFIFGAELNYANYQEVNNSVFEIQTPSKSYFLTFSSALKNLQKTLRRIN